MDMTSDSKRLQRNMNADCSQNVGIEQQLKELTTLIESLCKERIMFPASGNIFQNSSEKNEQDEVKLLQDFVQKCSSMAKQFQELRLNLSLALPHELRTPLNAILGFSQYLMTQHPHEVHHSEAILRIYSSIYESALRMHHLIENYLLYAKLQIMTTAPEAVKCEYCQQYEDVNMLSLIQSSAGVYAERVGRKEDLHLKLDNKILRISRLCLQKVLEELLDNAFKFSEPGTPISIATHISERQWSLHVVDQGRGMTVEQIERIGAYMQFERSYYAQQGSGLGLTIVQLLIQLQGGNVTIKSVPQQGTTVIITLPRRAA